MNASVGSQNKSRKNCTGRYLRGLRNINGDHLVIPSESNILEKQVIFSLYMAQLLFHYFLFKVQKTKIKITFPKVIGDRCFWEGTSRMNA